MKFGILGTILLLSMISGVGVSHAFERQGAYVGGGAGIGSMNFSEEAAEIEDALDDTLVLVEAHGGYRFNPYIALEGQLWGGANDTDEDFEEATFAAVAGRAILSAPVSKIVDLYAAVGYYSGDSDVSLDDSDSQSGMTYGAGVQMNFGAKGNFGVRIAYDIYDTDGLVDDVQGLTASFQYNFFRDE